MGSHFIVYLSLVNIITNLCYSIYAPVLPLELEKLGVSPIWNGAILACFALADIVAALVVPYTLENKNKKLMIVLSMIVMGVSVGCF